MLVFLKDNMTTAERGESLLNKHTGSSVCHPIPLNRHIFIISLAWAIPSSLSPYGVSSRESHLLQHYASEYSQVSDFNTPAHRSNIENMARIALAIDYDGNVHRSFLPMAMSHRALLNAIFAASSAHLSRWQNKADTSSHRYAIQALVELEKSLRDPVVASSETTLATMLCLIGLEVCFDFVSLIQCCTNQGLAQGWKRIHQMETSLSRARGMASVERRHCETRSVS
jgi:hypothetical protein